MTPTTEHQIQVVFIAWAKTHYPDVLVYAIPNGGHRNKLTAFKLKQEGVLAGVPDLFVADGKPGLYIELKEPKKGKVSTVQKEVIEKLTSAGYPVRVCYGVDEAKQAMTEYLSATV
jgi:hypothetical protein